MFTVGTVVENLLVCGVPSLSHRGTLHTIDSFQSRDQLEDLEGKTSAAQACQFFIWFPDLAICNPD